MSPTLEAEGSIACAIFSHLEHPRDRIALAAVSRVFRDAEKSDASLPGGLSALKRLTDKFHNETKFAEALYWYRKGADRGDAGCMHMIGLCYRYGNGVELDHRKAFEWEEKASELGHTYATSDLAEYCEEGDGVDKDEAKAVELYVKAAGLGHSLSAQRLGAYYEHGKCGVAVDKKEALKWYRVAVELGYTYQKMSKDDKSHVDRLELELAATHTN
jgi:TPR repeat protein